LNAYLEGTASRADAEGLLMRLHLAADDRDAVERSLRVADEVTAAVRGSRPPAGLGERLGETLRACATPAALPGWVAEDFEGRAAGPGEADLLDAAVEGRVSLEQLRAMRDAGELSDDGAEGLEELERIAAAAGEASAPAGMGTRLAATLRGMNTSVVDEAVARRLLGGTGSPRKGLGTPDVRAASDEDGDQ
jgi:hypothetical protein